MDQKTWTAYPRSGDFLRDRHLAQFMDEMRRYPEQTWGECQRGDYLLAAAEKWGAPRRALIAAANDIAEYAGNELQPRWVAEIDNVSKNLPPESEEPEWGRYTRHWLGHIWHGMADCMHAKAHALHLYGHKGAMHAALAADHLIASMCIAYVDPNGDVTLNRNKGMQEGYRITAEIARKHISFDMLQKQT